MLKFAFCSGTSKSSSLLFCKNGNLCMLALNEEVFFILPVSSSTYHAIVIVLSYPMNVALIGLLSGP